MMSQALMSALSDKNYNLVIEILSKGKCDVDSEDINGQSPIHLAAKNRYINLLEWLSTLKFDINKKDKEGYTALHRAVLARDLEVVKKLIHLKADIHCFTNKDDTPLHCVVDKDDSDSLAISAYLLKMGASTDYGDFPNGYTPLDVAVLSGSILQVKSLLKLGCRIESLHYYEQIAKDKQTDEHKFTRIVSMLRAYKNSEWSEQSDTDSEDQPDYQFCSPISNLYGISISAKKHAVLRGEINNNPIFFEEQKIIPNGDCAFIGLGTDRKTLKQTLYSYRNQPKKRELLWPEIAEAIMTSDFRPKGAEQVLDDYYTNSTNRLKAYCSEKSTFLAYLNLLSDPYQQVWLGYHSAMLYAKAKGMNLFIWCKKDNHRLKLLASSESKNSTQAIHLLHTNGFTHFNFLVIKEEFETSLDKMNTQLQNMSLLDNAQFAVAHYRGVHFYKEHFNKTQRRNEIQLRKAQQSGKIIPLGLHSNATYELAGQSVLYDDNTNEIVGDAFNQILSEREKALVKKSAIVQNRILNLQHETSVSHCLGESKASRDIYDTRFDEYIQRYVNSYTKLITDMQREPKRNINDGRLGARVVNKIKILKSLNFTKLPFVSTSEDPHWGLEYATAFLNWDKTLHSPREGNITVLAPCYQADGHPRFPYLGILHFILHSQQEINHHQSARILDLFTQDKIDLKCSSPGGHAKGGYIKARERVFVGGIDAHHVKLSMIIRVPNFSPVYRDFIKTKYHMNKADYENFKSKLQRYGKIGANGNPINLDAFKNTEQCIIQHVIQHLEKIVKAYAEQIAYTLNFQLGYLSINSQSIEIAPIELEKFIAAKNVPPKLRKH